MSKSQAASRILDEILKELLNMNRIHINENGINLVLEIDDNNEAKLLHFSALPFNENDITSVPERSDSDLLR